MQGSMSRISLLVNLFGLCLGLSVAVLALAEAPGLGVTNPELRAKHIDAINRFRQD